MHASRLIQVVTAVGLLLATISLHAKPIYKCQVNGAVQFTEEKCDEQAKPIELKGLSAPLQPVDMNKLKALEANERVRQLESRINMRQKRINHYRRQMNAEVESLQNKARTKKAKPHKSLPKNSVQEQETTTQLKDIAGSVDLDPRGTLSEQVNSVVLYYQTLISAEEFQIRLLLEQLRLDQQKLQSS